MTNKSWLASLPTQDILALQAPPDAAAQAGPYRMIPQRCGLFGPDRAQRVARMKRGRMRAGRGIALAAIIECIDFLAWIAQTRYDLN